MDFQSCTFSHVWTVRDFSQQLRLSAAHVKFPLQIWTTGSTPYMRTSFIKVYLGRRCLQSSRYSASMECVLVYMRSV